MTSVLQLSKIMIFACFSKFEIHDILNCRSKLSLSTERLGSARSTDLSKSSIESLQKTSITAKLELHKLNFMNSEEMRNEITKYPGFSTLPTQENIIPFLLNESSKSAITTAFMLLIGKIDCSEATKAFLPLPGSKNKLIQDFLVLIFNMKSMMVDKKEQIYR